MAALGGYNTIWDEHQNVHKYLFFNAEDALNFCKKNSQIIKAIKGHGIKYGTSTHGRIFATNLESFLTISQINFRDDLEALKADEQTVIKDKIDYRVFASGYAQKKTIDTMIKRTKELEAELHIVNERLDKSGKNSRMIRLSSEVASENVRKNVQSDAEVEGVENLALSQNIVGLAELLGDKSKIGGFGRINRLDNQTEYIRFMAADAWDKKRIIDIVRRNKPLPLDDFETLYKVIDEDLLQAGKKIKIVGTKGKNEGIAAKKEGPPNKKYGTGGERIYGSEDKLYGTADKLDNEQEEELLRLLLEDEGVTELRDKLYKIECYYNKLIGKQIARLNKNNVALVPPSRSEAVETKPFRNSTALKMCRGIKVRVRILKSVLLDLWNEV
jgi:hypothetical protein